MSVCQISHHYANAEAGNPLSFDLNIQISQLFKSNKRRKKWWESKEYQHMVKIKLAGYYTFFHFKVQHKISIIRTINYSCKMANVHPCQVECTLIAFPQTENVKIWSLLMVLQERVITAWSKLICFLPDELLYFIAGWHFKVIMALLTPANFSCSVVLVSLSFSLSLWMEFRGVTR